MEGHSADHKSSPLGDSTLGDTRLSMDTQFPKSLFDSLTSSDEETEDGAATPTSAPNSAEVNKLLASALRTGDSRVSSGSDDDDGSDAGIVESCRLAAMDSEVPAVASAPPPARRALLPAVEAINLTLKYPRGMAMREFLALFSPAEFAKLASYHDGSEWMRVATLAYVLGDRTPSLRMKPTWLAQQLGRKMGLAVPMSDGMNREWFRLGELGALLGVAPPAGTSATIAAGHARGGSYAPTGRAAAAYASQRAPRSPPRPAPSPSRSAECDFDDSFLTITGQGEGKEVGEKEEEEDGGLGASGRPARGQHGRDPSSGNDGGSGSRGASPYEKLGRSRRSLLAPGGAADGKAPILLLDALLAPTVFSQDVSMKGRRLAANTAAWRSAAHAAREVKRTRRVYSGRCCATLTLDVCALATLAALNGAVLAWQGLSLAAFDGADARVMRQWARGLGHACSLNLAAWLLATACTTARAPLSVQCTEKCKCARRRNAAALAAAATLVAHVALWIARACAEEDFKCVASFAVWWSAEASVVVTIGCGVVAVVAFAAVTVLGSSWCGGGREGSCDVRRVAPSAASDATSGAQCCAAVAAYGACAVALVAAAAHVFFAQVDGIAKVVAGGSTDGTNDAGATLASALRFLPGPGAAGEGANALDWRAMIAPSWANATERAAHVGAGTLWTRLLHAPTHTDGADATTYFAPNDLLFPWYYLVALAALLCAVASRHKHAWRIACCGWMCPLAVSAQIHSVEAAGGALLRLGFSLDGRSHLRCCGCSCGAPRRAKRRNLSWRAGQWVLLRVPGSITCEWKAFSLATGDDGSGEASVLVRNVGSGSLGARLQQFAAPLEGAALFDHLTRERVASHTSNYSELSADARDSGLSIGLGLNAALDADELEMQLEGECFKITVTFHANPANN